MNILGKHYTAHAFELLVADVGRPCQLEALAPKESRQALDESSILKAMGFAAKA